MKTSNKILLVLSVVPFIIIFIMLSSLRNILDKETVVINQDIDRSGYQTEYYDLGPFEKIRAEGVWEIVLKGGDQFRIELETPPDSLSHTSVTRQGNTLLLTDEKKFFSTLKCPRISITVPSISGLDLKGESDVRISNLKLSKLDIDLKGVSSISGIDSSVEQFFCNGSGMVNVDFMLMPSTDAYFNFNGVYMIMVHMNGGELAGRLNGPGRLITEGNITNNSIRADNPDFITHK